MTQYETLSLVLSAAAILVSIGMPIAQFIYRMLRRPRLEVLPFDAQPLTLVFDLYGSYARFAFSILSEKNSCIVKSISLRIRPKNADWCYCAKWVQLKPIAANWLYSGPQQAAIGGATLVHPIKIGVGKLEPLNTEFAAEGDENRSDRIKRVCDAVGSACQELSSVEEVLSDQRVEDAMDDLGGSCLWLEGAYVAEINIEYDAKGKITRIYSFEVDRDQAAILRGNVVALATMAVPRDMPGNRQQLQSVSVEVRRA